MAEGEIELVQRAGLLGRSRFVLGRKELRIERRRPFATNQGSFDLAGEQAGHRPEVLGEEGAPVVQHLE